MPRNLIICCDGTNNQFGSENTSVVRIVKVLNRDPTCQRVFYDPGVGTLPEPGLFSKTGKKISEIFGLAFGTGLLQNVEEAYTFLMEQWQPGDRVFMFGFSRGAYTVRTLASLLHMFGLLPTGGKNLLPYLFRQFKASRSKLDGSKEKAQAFWSYCDDFRETFSRAIPDDAERRFPIHFVGLWDTVSSVGWVWSPQSFPYTRRNPSIRTIRHAVAIDERRCFFRQNLFAKVDGQDFEELWFPGVHSDVGGGYPEADGGLWREPYRWMLDAAKNAGLEADPVREDAVWKHKPVPEKPWIERQHESLTLAWWPAEFFPKMPRGKARFPLPKFGLGSRRTIPPEAVFHSSARARYRDDPLYRPGNLPKGFDPNIS